ncbi:MAG: transposase [Fuerstiella sp.]|nr:transposase [Fuerstiella sp.]
MRMLDGFEWACLVSRGSQVLPPSIALWNAIPATSPCGEFIEPNTGSELVLLPPKNPNLNAYMERWFRSLKSECLDRMIFFSQRSLENAVREYVQHYHGERNHQGLGNELIEPEDDTEIVAGRIECRERLGGMLKYYHRRAA